MENERKPSFWAILPATVRYDPNLRPNAKLLYAEITALQESSGYCFASNRYFADNFGLQPATITSLLDNLSKAGYISVEILRDSETHEVVQRRIYTTGKLPDIADPSPIFIGDPSSKNMEDPPLKISGNNNTSNNNNPPKAPRRGAGRREPKKAPDWKPERFAGFWVYYPRGENKQGAIRAWDRLKPSDDLIDTMAKALTAQMRTEDWQRGIGVPYASTWLNQRRWEDEQKRPAACPLTAQAERSDLPEW